MEISYILFAVGGYAVAPYIYSFILDAFFSWQYNRYVQSHRKKDGSQEQVSRDSSNTS